MCYISISSRGLTHESFFRRRHQWRYSKLSIVWTGRTMDSRFSTLGSHARQLAQCWNRVAPGLCDVSVPGNKPALTNCIMRLCSGALWLVRNPHAPEYGKIRFEVEYDVGLIFRFAVGWVDPFHRAVSCIYGVLLNTRVRALTFKTLEDRNTEA